MMLKEMEPLLKEAGVKDNYLYLYDDSELLPITTIRSAYKWLTHIYSVTHAAAKSIKKLLPDELWNRYKMWEDFDNHREVKLLKQALRDLRKAIRTRNKPMYFKRGVTRAEIKKRKKTSHHTK